jgi:hypothetical protein
MPLLETRGSGSALAFGLNSSTGGLTLSGLILHLDASKSASYSGSGSTWFDISGNGNNATLVNGASFTTSGTGGHLSLDGGSQYIQLANNSASSPYTRDTFTIDFWVNRYTEGGANYEIFWSQDFTSHSPPYYTVHIRNDNASNHGGTNYFSSSGGFSTTPITNNGIVNEQWNNFIFTRDLSTGIANTYKNGVLLQNVTGQGSLTFYNNPLWLGKSNFQSSSRLRFGSVRYYDRALSAGEVVNNFAATKTRFGF